MRKLLVLTLVAMVVAQSRRPLDRDSLRKIFKFPSTTASSVTTTTATTEKLDIVQPIPVPNNKPCKCVPSYLCDSANVAVHVTNTSVTGSGALDVRFTDGTVTRTCRGSIDICCTAAKNPNEVRKPVPDSSVLKGCGYSDRNILGFTVQDKGDESQFGEFPWVVALLDTAQEKYIGVGVLIHPQVVMTAAHKIRKYSAEELKVRAGEWDTRSEGEPFPFKDEDVVEIYQHENFELNMYRNDIALLKLGSPLQLAQHINMLCMPEQDESFENSKNCIANGWGKDAFDAPDQTTGYKILKKVVQDVLPRNQCNALLQRSPRLGSKFQLDIGSICAGGLEGIDMCQGDGGAPLACPIGNNRYKLAGLVAWGIGCGQKDMPGAFVSVSRFRRWVDAKMLEWGYDSSTYIIN